jgi:hypothetical protein
MISLRGPLPFWTPCWLRRSRRGATTPCTHSSVQSSLARQQERGNPRHRSLNWPKPSATCPNGGGPGLRLSHGHRSVTSHGHAQARRRRRIPRLYGLSPAQVAPLVGQKLAWGDLPDRRVQRQPPTRRDAQNCRYACRRGLRLKMDQLNPPGTTVADFHNTRGWMRTRVTG